MLSWLSEEVGTEPVHFKLPVAPFGVTVFLICSKNGAR